MKPRTMITSLAAAVVVLVAAAFAASDPWKAAARYEFEYRVRLADLAPAGRAARVWIPYPAENRDQKILSSKIESPWEWRLTREHKFGNRMVYLEGRPEAGIGDFVMRLEVERRPSRGVPISEAPFAGELSPALYGTPDRLVPLAGVIEKIAIQEGQGRKTEQEKIQAFYDYVYRTMSYSKDGTGWGRGDAIWACTNKRGNCTDFHSLFIGMLRSQGIPARFLIGFPIPDGSEGAIGGYHCWAEFYDAKRGWLPVDASEAKKKGLKEAYFGSLPNDRIEFSIGRDVVLVPKQKGEPLNYFIYPYAEVDGRAAEPKAEFHFKRREEKSL
ncbi:MAG: transglutaminase-like domain-containing protein [Candidatus Binatia bacterium]